MKVEKKVKSVIPIYLLGVTWIIGGGILPIYNLGGILVTAAASIAVYLGASKVIPQKTITVEVPDAPISTGEASTDKLLTDIQQELALLNELNDSIANPALSAQILRMKKAGDAIVKEVTAHPEKEKKIRRFATYYLPSATKILTSYAKMSSSGAAGANAQELMKDVEHNAAVIAASFEGQLDSLFSEEVLDITTDIDVLQSMMKSDGLIKDEIAEK